MLIIIYPDVGMPGGEDMIITRILSWSYGVAVGVIAPSD
jgi:hypothetical protein